MKIQTNKEGKLYIDGQEMETKDLTVEVLEKIITKSLNNEVEYILESDSLPIAKFFNKIQSETADGSNLKSKINEIKESIAKQEVEIENTGETYADE